MVICLRWLYVGLYGGECLCYGAGEGLVGWGIGRFQTEGKCGDCGEKLWG